MFTNMELAYYYPAGHAVHNSPGHPERPERVEAIRTALHSAGWWDPFPKLEPTTISKPIMYTVHSPAWLSQLKLISQGSGYVDINTYVTPASFDVAIRSAGGTVAVATAVWRGEAKRGFVLARPPGHHATRHHGGGFCLLNNIALATESLIQQEGAQRLAIVDLDLHHGNGTQDIFWQRGDVLYISTHQMPLYPGSGYLYETGEGLGKGATANFPLPPSSGDMAFRAVFDELVLPLLDRFAPEMLLVSFGFDTHWLDQLGSLLLSAGEYRNLITSLTEWADGQCGGRVILVLEGGYDLLAGSACGTAATAALLGLPWKDPIGPSPYVEGKNWRQMVEEAKKLFNL